MTTFNYFKILTLALITAISLGCPAPSICSLATDCSENHDNKHVERSSSKPHHYHKSKKHHNHRRSVKEIAFGVNAALEALTFEFTDKKSVWCQDYLEKNPKLKSLIIDFKNSKYASSIKNFNPSDNSVNKVKEELEKAGFCLVNHDKNEKSSYLIYLNKDGGGIKLSFDKQTSSKSQTVTHITKMVMLKLGTQDFSWKEVAFLVSDAGVILPKSKNGGMRVFDEKNHHSDANFGWRELIIQESMIKISKK